MISVFDNFTGELFVQQSGVHRQQVTVRAVFYGAFSVAMDQNGALFGLLSGVATDVDKGFDDVVEGMDIVVIKHQLATVILQYGCFIFCLWTYVWFVLFQFNQ